LTPSLGEPRGTTPRRIRRKVRLLRQNEKAL
jgi:hypothetical protein